MLKNIFSKIFKSFCSTEFLKFLLVGGSAALINFFSRFLFQVWYSYIVSVALAFILGSIISFIFNKLFTFKDNDEKTTVQLVKFTIMTIVSVFIAAFVAYLAMNLYELFKVTLIAQKGMESVAHIIAIGVTTIYNFLAMKFFSFKNLNLKKTLVKDINT